MTQIKKLLSYLKVNVCFIVLFEDGSGYFEDTHKNRISFNNIIEVLK